MIVSRLGKMAYRIVSVNLKVGHRDSQLRVNEPSSRPTFDKLSGRRE